MNRRNFLGAAGLALAAGVAGATPPRKAAYLGPICTSAPPDAPAARRVALAAADGLVIAGTRLFKEGFLDELLPTFKVRTSLRAAMQGGGCGDGVSGVLNGTAQLGCICCPIEGSPARGLHGLHVAHDMKVIVAHPDVACDGLTRAQLRGVLTGETRNWKPLGGPDRPIALVINDHCPDFVEPVRQAMLGNRQAWSRSALVTKTDQKQLETTARFEHSVGVNSWILAEPFVRAGQLKVLALDGVKPTLEATAAGRYRLSGPMVMIFREWNEELMTPFFQMIYGSGRSVLAKHVVPVSAREAGFPRRWRA